MNGLSRGHTLLDGARTIQFYFKESFRGRVGLRTMFHVEHFVEIFPRLSSELIGLQCASSDVPVPQSV
jgi:hypothetical protein